MKTETAKGASTNAVSSERGRRGRHDIIIGILKIAKYGNTRFRIIFFPAKNVQ